MIPFVDFGGEGAVLHFAHANGYPPGTYRQLLTGLAGRFRVLAMQHRPLWADAPGPETLTDWHVFAQDLMRFFEQQALRGVVGVGHSMGAVATLFAAVHRPELFRALVLIEPIFLPPTWLEALQANPALIEEVPVVKGAKRRRYHWPSREAAFAHFRPKRVFARLSDEALWDYVVAALRPAGDGGVTLAFSREWEAAVYRQSPNDVWALLPAVTQPTLGMRAEESNSLVPEAWEVWREVQPEAKLVEFADSSHLLPLERPDDMFETIISFLSSLN